MGSSYLDYKPSSDIAALEILWRQEKAMLDKRQQHHQKYTENIRLHHSRGMSRATLEQKYGREAVLLALGQENPCPTNTPQPGPSSISNGRLRITNKPW